MKQDKTGKLEEGTPGSSDAASAARLGQTVADAALAGGGKLTHQYSIEDLRAIWSFVRCDFERFLELLAWLDTLPDAKHKEQLVAAHSLHKVWNLTVNALNAAESTSPAADEGR